MLNFKKTSLTVVALLLIMAVIHFFIPFRFAYFFIPAGIYLIFLVWGSADVCSQFYMPIKCVSEDKSKIHLTFDDGPNPETTPQILDILKENSVQATFFCIGKKIEQYPELLKRISDEGHTIGNHSWSHSNFFPSYRTSKVIKELQKTNELIMSITGKECTLFRPPFGVTNPNIAGAVKKLSMQAIGWNVRTLDTNGDKETVLEKLKRAVQGDIVLLHDDRSQTVEILRAYFRS